MLFGLVKCVKIVVHWWQFIVALHKCVALKYHFYLSIAGDSFSIFFILLFLNRIYFFHFSLCLFAFADTEKCSVFLSTNKVWRFGGERTSIKAELRRMQRVVPLLSRSTRNGSLAHSCTFCICVHNKEKKKNVQCSVSKCTHTFCL